MIDSGGRGITRSGPDRVRWYLPPDALGRRIQSNKKNNKKWQVHVQLPQSRKRSFSSDRRVNNLSSKSYSLLFLHLRNTAGTHKLSKPWEISERPSWARTRFACPNPNLASLLASPCLVLRTSSSTLARPNTTSWWRFVRSIQPPATPARTRTTRQRLSVIPASLCFLRESTSRAGGCERSRI